MEHEMLQAAKSHLKEATAERINCLERILDQDGFREKIIPTQLGYFNWYSQNVLRDDEDKSNYLLPYAKGFVRRNPVAEAIAGYGIISELDNDCIPSSCMPHHFFFIDFTGNSGNNIEMVKYLADKAKYSPGSPTSPAADSWVDRPLPDGAMPVFWGFMALGILGEDVLSHAYPAISKFCSGDDTSLLFVGGLALASWAGTRSPPVKKALVKFGMEDYSAPARSSVTRPEYGIRGLERYSFMHP